MKFKDFEVFSMHSSVSEGVKALDFVKDGSILISAGREGAIFAYDLEGMSE